MTALKKVKSKSLTDKENKLGLNFALIKYQIKDYTKKLELLKEQISILFDEKHQGYIQKITRVMKRFDTTKFKSENPELYEKYLVDSNYLEFKPFIEELENAK